MARTVAARVGELDVLASEERYAAHIRPVWNALPDDLRGSWKTEGGRPTLVASYGDLRRVRRLGPTSIARLEHGSGQSYAGAGGSAARHSSYAGGRDSGDVSLFLVPNEHAAERWRTAYPGARVEIVGSPIVETLPARVPGPGPIVAVSFHVPFYVVPETTSAFRHYAGAVRELARSFRVIGHAHPLYLTDMALWYRRNGIELVPDFREICRRADVYVADNSSTIFEFAATGRSVVLLNSPAYRRDVEHGLRFWSAADVGVQVDDPACLEESICLALSDPPKLRRARDRALRTVYAVRDGSAALAAATIGDWLRECRS